MVEEERWNCVGNGKRNSKILLMVEEQTIELCLGWRRRTQSNCVGSGGGNNRILLVVEEATIE